MSEDGNGSHVVNGMVTQLVLTKLEQVPPFTNDTAQVHVGFEIHGILPDFVQIYASSASGTGPSQLADMVDMSPPEFQYDDIITLQAGTYYTIYVCPRTGSKDNPDETINGEYWEWSCAVSTIITQASPSPPGGPLVPPVITNLNPQPATMNQGNRITVSWSSPTNYDKFLVWWTEDGVALQQGEIDAGGTSGSWTAPTAPGRWYTFQVEGGVSSGWSYDYSGWGPKVRIFSPPNLTSLRQYLLDSGVNPVGRSLRSLMPSNETLRKFMKL